MRLGELLARARGALRRRPPREIDLGNGDRWVLRRGRWRLERPTLTDEERESIIDRYRRAGLL